MIAGLKDLTYLDDRPVKQVDHEACEAWLEGGFEAEKKVRKVYYDEARRKERSYVTHAIEMEEEYKRKKRLALDRIEREARRRKEELLQKHEELKQSEWPALLPRTRKRRERRGLLPGPPAHHLPHPQGRAPARGERPAPRGRAQRRRRPSPH